MKYYHHPPVVINIAPHRGFLLQNVKNVKRIAKKMLLVMVRVQNLTRDSPPCQVICNMIINDYYLYCFNNSNLRFVKLCSCIYRCIYVSEIQFQRDYEEKREFKYFFSSSAYAFPLFYATFAGKGGG